MKTPKPGYAGCFSGRLPCINDKRNMFARMHGKNKNKRIVRERWCVRVRVCNRSVRQDFDEILQRGRRFEKRESLVIPQLLDGYRSAPHQSHREKLASIKINIS